jgi:AcrR family transcriptional regulator
MPNTASYAYFGRLASNLRRPGCRRKIGELERTFESPSFLVPASAQSVPEAAGRKAVVANPPADSRFDRRLAEILQHATEVFCEKGYDGASMRDLSRATGISLAGLYYYFDSKEKLLYLIQKHTFETIIARLRERLAGATDPEERVRIFIQNHLEYFLANQQAMKVLSHEDDVLTGEYGAEIASIKRDYYRICLGLVEELRPPARSKRNGRNEAPDSNQNRLAVLSLFGMMNWIYTWHNRRSDADAGAIARQMGDIFLNGILCGAKAARNGNRF